MLFNIQSVSIFFTTGIIAYVVFYIEKYRIFYKKYPPGPLLCFPILGHLPLLGKKRWETFRRWKKNYGPIFSIRMGTFPAVVLSDPQIIRDACNRQEFSGRPKLAAYSTYGEKSLIGNDGPHAIEQRHFAVKCLKSFQITKLLEEKTLQEMDEIFKKLQKVSKNWKKPISVTDRFNVPAINALWSLFMGKRFDHEDRQLVMLTESLHELTALDGILRPLFYFVSFLPKLFPRASCMQRIEDVLHNTRNFVNYEFQKHFLVERSGEPANFMEAFHRETILHKTDIKSSFFEPHGYFSCTMTDIFCAAMETTSTEITWFILLMTLHPDVQDRLYEEIRSVIGLSRPPSLNDRQHCHFAEAVVNEVLRFSCPVPMSVFHRTMEDVEDFYGFRIPADTVIIPDLAGIQMDSELWKHPEQFDPSRFIDAHGKFKKSENLMPFGIGKRICIGETIARKQIFLYVAGISQRFQLSHPPGKKPSIEKVSGIVTKHHDFQVLFKERN